MIRLRPTSAAMASPRTRSARISCISPAPSACAVKATVLVRRKENSQNMQSKTTDAIATPPSSVASPSRPMRSLGTTPISGVVRLATIAGPAMAKTRALVTFELKGGGLQFLLCEHDLRANAWRLSQRKPVPPFPDHALSPARGAEQPHQQPQRNDDHGAEQEVAPQPVDRVEAEIPDTLKQQFDAAQDIPGIETDRGQHDPDQDREQDQPERHGQRRAAQKAMQRIVRRRHGSRLVVRHRHCLSPRLSWTILKHDRRGWEPVLPPFRLRFVNPSRILRAPKVQDLSIAAPMSRADPLRAAACPSAAG